MSAVNKKKKSPVMEERDRQRTERLKLVADCRLDGHHIELPEELGCSSCQYHDVPCLLRKTIKYPNSSAGLRCACCQTDQCSFLTKNYAHRRAPLQTWLNNNPARSDVSSLQQPTNADGSPVTPTTTFARPIKIVIKTPITPQSTASSPQVDSNSDSGSDSTLTTTPSDGPDVQSPQAPTTNGQVSHLKRSRRASNDETKSPTTKAARFDTTSTEDDVFAGGPSDSHFDQHVRGLITYHQTIRKRNEDLDSAKKELEKEVERMQKLHEAWQGQVADLGKWNEGVVKERDTALAAVVLAAEKETEQAAELVKLRTENEKSKKDLETLEARLEMEVVQSKILANTSELLEKERDAGLNIIAGLKSDVAKIQADTTERDAAVKNANASRLERDIAQKALEAAVESRRQTSNKLGKTTTALEGAEFEIERLQKEVQQLRDECADKAAIKTQMIDLQTSQVEIEQAKNRYKTELADAEGRIENLKAKAQLADGRLLERQESDAKLATTKDELKEQAKEMKKVRIELERSQRAVVEIKRNDNIQKLELHRVHKELKESHGVKREGNGAGGPLGGRVKMEARVVIDISDDEEN